MPVFHYSDLTVERDVLLYAIVTGLTIDVGRLIVDSIIHTVRNRLGLFFPSLITRLCAQAGVEVNKDEEVLHPKRPIDDALLHTIKSSRMPAPREVATVLSSRPLTVIERLERLEHWIDCQDQFLARKADYHAVVFPSFGQMFHSFAAATGCDLD